MAFRGGVPIGFRRAAATAPNSSASPARCLGSMTWASSGTDMLNPVLP